MRVLVLALLLAAAVAVDARACSCAGIDAESALRSGDAAIEGVVVARKRVGKENGFPIFDHTVRVTREYNVQAPARFTLRGGGGDASCGLSLRVGQRFGLWVKAPVAARIEASACEMVDPRELRQAAGALPRPRGSGRLALLVGGLVGRDSTFTAYDERGRLLAYGFGGGRVLAACPGGARFLQQGAGRRLLVRSTATLRVLRTLSFPVRPVDARCGDPRARDVVVVGAGGGRTLARPDRVLSRTTSRGVIALGRDVAVAISGEYEDPEDTLHVVDLESGAMRELARIRKMPSPGRAFSADGRRLAFSGFDLRELDERVPASVFVLDLQTGALAEHEIPADDEGVALWTSAEEFLLVPGREGRAALRFDAAAQPLGTRPSLRGATTLAAVGGRILALAGNRLYGAPLTGGRARALARLPVVEISDVVAVPERPLLRAPRRLPVRRGPRAAASRRCER